jgi:putative ubiquitin-RnfH superfamily antitoxin RatB of RatAB toxin-antitoxin module
MKVSVAYAGPEGVAIVDLDLDNDARVADAVAASGVVARFGLFEAALSYAIFGQHAAPGTPLREGDRVELLRPLFADPKEARRKRAAEHPLPRKRPRRKTRT